MVWISVPKGNRDLKDIKKMAKWLDWNLVLFLMGLALILIAGYTYSESQKKNSRCKAIVSYLDPKYLNGSDIVGCEVVHH